MFSSGTLSDLRHRSIAGGHHVFSSGTLSDLRASKHSGRASCVQLRDPIEPSALNERVPSGAREFSVRYEARWSESVSGSEHM